MLGETLLPKSGIAVERGAVPGVRPGVLTLDPGFHVPEENPNVHLKRLLAPQEDDPLYKSIYHGIRDLLHPPQLPPLEITSRPVDPSGLKGLDGLYAGNEVRAGIGSLLINVGIVGLLLYAGSSFKPLQKAMNKVVVLVAPAVPLKPVENSVAAGAGGGGRQSMVKKEGSRKRARRFIPQPVEPVQTRLQAPVWMSTELSDVPSPDAGDPTGLTAIIGSAYGGEIGNGWGGSGIGNGSGGGIGSGNGTGAGNGSGGAVYRSGGGVTNPVPVYRPEAQYPEEARKAGCQGSVLLSLVVDETGKPANINVIVPLAMGLDEAAVEAVSQWRFIPGRKDGKAVPVLVKVQVTFRLL